MARLESVFSFLMAAFCAVYLFLAWGIERGTVSNPGAGFITVVLGVVGLATALLVFYKSLGISGRQQTELNKAGLTRFVKCLGAFVLFIPLFKYLGTIIAVFVLVFALTKILGSAGWRKPVALAAVSSIIAYVVFVILLEVPLPAGILELL